MDPRNPSRALLSWGFEHEEEDEYSTSFDSFFSSQRPMFSLGEKAWTPPTDIYEAEGTLHVKMEIAGVSEKEIEITVDENLLKVRGRRREPVSGESKATFHLMEIRYGAFERVFGMPAKVDLDAVSATYRDGFLMIEIPKVATRPHAVPVEAD